MKRSTKSQKFQFYIYRLTGLIYNPTKAIESLRLEPKKKKQKLIRWKISLVICRFVIDLIMGKIGFRDSNKINLVVSANLRPGKACQ